MKNKSSGFTLAEVLITMSIIGIVASITIPQLVKNMNDFAYVKSRDNFALIISEAMNQMKTNSEIVGYDTNDKFVGAFARYMKINAKCDSTHFANCFVPTFRASNGDVVDVNDLKTGTNFGKTTNTSALVGVQFSNGVSAIIAYDPNCQYADPYDNQASALGCLSMLYDINGYSKPNVIGKDIVLQNATLSVDDCMKLPSGLCVSSSDLVITPVAFGSAEYNALKAKGLIQFDSGYANDYWAGALYACDQLGMHLPNLSAPVNNVVCPGSGGGELCDLYQNKVFLSLAATSYWSSTEYGAGLPTYAWYMSMSSGQQMRYYKNYTTFKTRCVK